MSCSGYSVDARQSSLLKQIRRVGADYQTFLEGLQKSQNTNTETQHELTGEQAGLGQKMMICACETLGPVNSMLRCMPEAHQIIASF
jgi:hypothetical protein